MVPHKSLIQRNPRLLRISKGRVRPRVRHRHHNVRFHWVQLGQLPPHPSPSVTHIASAQRAVRTGKINKLENAQGFPRRLRMRLETPKSIRIHYHHFPRLYFPNKFGSHQIECTGFARKNVRIVQLPDDQRTEPKRITRRNHLILPHQNQRIGSMHSRKSLGQRPPADSCIRPRNKMQDHLTIRRRLKNRSSRLQLLPKTARVDQIAIMRNRNLTSARFYHQRLRIF